MGYGKRAIQQLIEYYSGNIVNLSEQSNGNADEMKNEQQTNKVMYLYRI